MFEQCFYEKNGKLGRKLWKQQGSFPIEIVSSWQIFDVFNLCEGGTKFAGSAS